MKALVTGGGGFLGGAIVRALLDRGDEVRTAQRGDYPWHRERAVDVVQGDLASSDIARAAVAGCDVVFHVAAKAGVWGTRQEYFNANVKATSALIKECRRTGVRNFVFTSSPSVTFHGRDEDGVNESHPYPSRYLAHYPATKAEAEKLVLSQVNHETSGDAPIATVALRPHLIWGPGDRHLVPRIVDRARAGKLKFVGDGRKLVDSTYIDNAVHAHLLAADQLLEQGLQSPCAGKAYYISNGEPIAMAELINRILAAAGMQPVDKHVPPMIAYGAGAVFEAIHKLFRIKREPIMTRFVAKQLSCSHWYDLSAAKHDLGYEPVVTTDEGMKQLAQWLSDHPI